jgi:rubrerythrin
MKLQTASSVISFAKNLETESAKVYQDLSQLHTEDKAVLLSFAEENRKNIVQIERAYYGVISDAIEGCFAFDVDPEVYAIEISLKEKLSYSEALHRAIQMEEKIVRFYTEAAEQSKSLMADVPRAFMRVVKKRGDRIAKLRSL